MPRKKKHSATKAKAKQDIQDLQQRMGQVGEDLLLSLVQEMSKKGNLKETVQAMHGKQAILTLKLKYLVTKSISHQSIRLSDYQISSDMMIWYDI